MLTFLGGHKSLYLFYNVCNLFNSLHQEVFTLYCSTKFFCTLVANIIVLWVTILYFVLR